MDIKKRIKITKQNYNNKDNQQAENRNLKK